jgi:hypothetical protein
VSLRNRATFVISALLVALGGAIIIRTALLGGGVGFLFGAIVLVAGAVRLRYSQNWQRRRR